MLFGPIIRRAGLFCQPIGVDKFGQVVEEVDGQIVPPDADFGASDGLLAAITSEVQHEAHLVLAFLQVVHYRFVNLQRLGLLLLRLVLLGILLFGQDLACKSILMRLKANGHVVVVDVVALNVSGGASAATAAGIG